MSFFSFQKHYVNSPFASEFGSFNYRKDSLEDHDESERHESAVVNYCNFYKIQLGSYTLESYFQKKGNISNESLLILLNNAYFLAWRQLRFYNISNFQ